MHLSSWLIWAFLATLAWTEWLVDQTTILLLHLIDTLPFIDILPFAPLLFPPPPHSPYLWLFPIHFLSSLAFSLPLNSFFLSKQTCQLNRHDFILKYSKTFVRFSSFSLQIIFLFLFYRLIFFFYSFFIISSNHFCFFTSFCSLFISTNIIYILS